MRDGSTRNGPGRRRRLRKLWKRLQELRRQTLSRDALLLKLGAAKQEAGRADGLVDLQLPEATQAVTPKTFQFTWRKDQLRQTRRREGYLLRPHLTTTDPAMLWRYSIQLTEIEQAFTRPRLTSV